MKIAEKTEIRKRAVSSDIQACSAIQSQELMTQLHMRIFFENVWQCFQSLPW